MNSAIATNWQRHLAGLVAVIMRNNHPAWRSHVNKRYSTGEQGGLI